MPPTVANVPMNQINALPILSIDAASTPPSTVVVTGTGKIIRTWLPADSGINGQSSNVADPRGDPFAYLITNWLDFTGMAAVTLMLGIEVPPPFAGDIPGVSWSVRMIPMCTAGGVVVDPVPFPAPAPPNTRNMTGNYAAAANAPFPEVAVMGVPALTGLAGAIAYKLATAGWGTGTESPGSQVGVPLNGVFKLLFLSGTGADPELNYLTVIASS